MLLLPATANTTDQLDLRSAWQAVVQGTILLGVVVAQRYLTRAERR